MNTLLDEKKDDLIVEDLGEVRNIVVNLSTTDKKDINESARSFYEYVKELKEEVSVPEIVPTDEAVFTCRKSPCGNGTATFVRHTMRVYQRKFVLKIHDKNITKITSFLKEIPARAQIQML